jgi:hypothetical protein
MRMVIRLVLVFLNLTDKIHKRTKNTDVALHPGIFQGIDFHRERVCSALFQVHPRAQGRNRQMIERIS